MQTRCINQPAVATSSVPSRIVHRFSSINQISSASSTKKPLNFRPATTTTPRHQHRNNRSRMASSILARASAAPSSHQLLICGPGVLGSSLGKQWLEEFGAGSVTGQTNSTTNHPTLQALGLSTRLKSDANPNDETFPFVVYSAPPSGSEDYVGDVKAALQLWDGTGSFVFTSSAGVYAVEDGSACNEDAPVVAMGASPRTDTILSAEKAVLEAGGCVVRLVGLYHRTRGAHTFFLKQGEVARWGGYIVNLIHYEDAARLTGAVLRGQGNSTTNTTEGSGYYRGEVFLGCDNKPVTFADMMKAIEASGQLPGKTMFSGEEGPVKGKRMSNDATKKQLQWEPVYGGGIEEFFAQGGHDWYSEAAVVAPTGAPHS